MTLDEAKVILQKEQNRVMSWVRTLARMNEKERQNSGYLTDAEIVKEIRQSFEKLELYSQKIEKQIID